MINIRTALNERLSKFGGNIGYGIRPTERRKGYNKINLYMGLIEAQKLGLEIIEHMRKRCDAYTKEYNLNFTCLATPAEGLSGRFGRY